MEIHVDHAVGLAYFGRGLTAEEFAELQAEIVDTGTLQRHVMSLDPSFLSMRFPPTGPGSSIPNAIVCLEDMAITTGEAEYALRQAVLALQVFRKRQTVEPLAVSMARFYVSDSAMRLYAAGEHAASAILDILGISEGDLDSGGGKRRTSLQAKLAAFLKRDQPTHPLTVAGDVLGTCPEWFKTLQYRGRLTHEQPTTVAGVGIVHRRQPSRWRSSVSQSNGAAVWQLSVGGGDVPETTIDAVLGDARYALDRFHAYATLLLEHYFQVLRSHGVTIDTEKNETSVSLFGAP